MIESTFTAQHGLLAIYDIDLYHKPSSGSQDWRNLVENGDGVIGLAIWFPKSKRENDIAVDYLVNKKFVVQQNSDNYKDDEDD